MSEVCVVRVCRVYITAYEIEVNENRYKGVDFLQQFLVSVMKGIIFIAD